MEKWPPSNRHFGHNSAYSSSKCCRANLIKSVWSCWADASISRLWSIEFNTLFAYDYPLCLVILRCDKSHFPPKKSGNIFVLAIMHQSKICKLRMITQFSKMIFVWLSTLLLILHSFLFINHKKIITGQVSKMKEKVMVKWEIFHSFPLVLFLLSS